MDMDQLARALAVLGALDPGRLPLHHAQVFLFIAQREPVTYRQVEEAFDISNASASRVVNSLGENAKHRKECLGLVEVIIDPSEGRRYLVRLTKKGKAMRDAIKAVA
jgi:DNA-binding MarR family transcriptional regulator